MAETPVPDYAEPAILCVDDDPRVLSSLQRLLRRHGWRVLLASSGEQAIEMLKQNEIQVLLCDEAMPGMRGLEVLRKARELSPRTARILLTAYCHDPRVVMPAVNSCEIDRLLAKPWDEEDLIEAMSSALGARPVEWKKQKDRLNARLQGIAESASRQEQ